MLDAKIIKDVAAKRADQIEDIDAMIEALEAPALAAKAMAATSDIEQVLTHFQSGIPILVAILTFVRPILFFRHKWQLFIDGIIEVLNVIIPPK